MEGLFLYKEIEDKSIVWFKNQNQYLILENNVVAILKALEKKTAIDTMGKELSEKIAIPLDITIAFIKDIEQKLFLPNVLKKSDFEKKSENTHTDCEFLITKFYKINDAIFKIDFESEYEAFLIHPKFSHLVIKPQENSNFHYKIFTKDEHTSLVVNNKLINSWHQKDIHYFQGKFSMMVTQNMHQKEEENWMGVFHASAVSNEKKAILFLGDSGNGKSTSLALLQANGFTCLADDFVPMDAKKQEVYSFPAAISIKKNSLETLIPMYPELNNAAEYHLKKLNKIVRYIPPNTTDFNKHFPCNELVFIKYQKDSPTIFKEISKMEAFQQLVPDSWISPIGSNAQIFLDWFESLRCYQLTYAVNTEMVQTVTKLFNDEL